MIVPQAFTTASSGFNALALTSSPYLRELSDGWCQANPRSKQSKQAHPTIIQPDHVVRRRPHVRDSGLSEELCVLCVACACVLPRATVVAVLSGSGL